EGVAELRVTPVDVDHLLVVARLGRHVPRRVRARLDEPARASHLHDAGEGPELDPAREHLPVLELVVAADVGAPDGKAHEGRALLADDGAAQPEVRAGPAAEVLAAGDVPAPEDRPARRTGVARARDVHEVAAPDARQRVVVDLRLEVHVVVAHLATGAAVSPDVRRLRRDVLLAAVQLDTLDAPLAQEG